MTKKILRSIYLDPETVEALDERALVESKTKAELVRTFIEQGLDRAAATVGEQAIDEAAVEQDQLVATVQTLAEQVATLVRAFESADKAARARFKTLERKLSTDINRQAIELVESIADVQLKTSSRKSSTPQAPVRTKRATRASEPLVTGPLVKKG